MNNDKFFLDLLLPETLISRKFDEQSSLYTYYKNAGLVDVNTRPYFLNLYSKFLSKIDLFIEKYKAKKIIDLGCGIGTTALYCGIKNYKYIGIDIDQESISIAKKRIERLSKISQSFIKPNLYLMDCSNLSKINDEFNLGEALVISQFAFNMMDPVRNKLISNLLKYNINSLIILDGNPHCIFNKFLKPSTNNNFKLSVGLINKYQKNFSEYDFNVEIGALFPKRSLGFIHKLNKIWNSIIPKFLARSLIYTIKRNRLN